MVPPKRLFKKGSPKHSILLKVKLLKDTLIFVEVRYSKVVWDLMGTDIRAGCSSELTEAHRDPQDSQV